MKFNVTAVTVMSMLLSSPCFAQTKDTIKKRVFGMNEVVISANKVEENYLSVPQQILVLDQKQIANAQAQTSADLLANTAGLFVQKSQMGGGSPVLRGFEANKILLVVDGIRMNNIIYRGGHLQNVITVDNAMLERVEVLYGPSSTIYGSDALGGVIHFVTKSPAFAIDSTKRNLGVNAYTRYGSVNNEMTGHVDFNIGGQKLASLTSVTYSSFGDLTGGKSKNPFYDTPFGERPYYADRVNGKDSLVANSDRYKQVNSGYSQYDIMQKFSFQQNAYTRHTVNLQFTSSTDIPRYDRLTDPASGGGLRYAQWYYGPQQRVMVAYSVDRKRASAYFQQTHVGVHYQDIEESRHNRSFGSNNLAHRVERVGVFGINLDAQRHVGGHNFRIGLEQSRNRLNSTATKENIATGVSTPTDTRYPDGGSIMDNMAAYATDTWHVGDKVTLTGGLRLGYVSLSASFMDTSFFKFPFNEAKQNNFVYSGNVGFIYRPAERWKLSALLSSGFRTPNVDDLAKVFESAAGTLIVPNSSLTPEKTLNAELGITRFLGNRLIWENAVYYTRYFDAIVTAPFTLNGQDSVVYDGVKSRIIANQNMGKAFIMGVSSSARAQFTQNWALSAGLNYTYGRIVTDTTDQPLDHIPPVQFRLQAIYTKNKFAADFFVNYQGAKLLKNYYLNGEDNEQYATAEGMPAWFTANLRVSYRLHTHFMIQVGIDNILDTQYRVFASGINAPGRNIFGVLKYNL